MLVCACTGMSHRRSPDHRSLPHVHGPVTPHVKPACPVLCSLGQSQVPVPLGWALEGDCTMQDCLVTSSVYVSVHSSSLSVLDAPVRPRTVTSGGASSDLGRTAAPP